MDMPSQLSDISFEQALFALGAVISGALTVVVLVFGSDPIQVVLFGAFSLYLLGGAVPQMHDRVPEYRRTGGMILGAIGAIGFFIGTSSVLPALFVMGGVAAYLRLL